MQSQIKIHYKTVSTPCPRLEQIDMLNLYVFNLMQH